MENLCGICERKYSSIGLEPCPNCGASWVEQREKRFDRKTEIKLKGKVYVISTVNLLFIHPGGFFETMIFEKESNKFLDFQKRYWTRKKAIQGHKRIVAQIKKSPKQFGL